MIDLIRCECGAEDGAERGKKHIRDRAGNEIMSKAPVFVCSEKSPTIPGWKPADCSIFLRWRAVRESERRKLIYFHFQLFSIMHGGARASLRSHMLRAFLKFRVGRRSCVGKWLIYLFIWKTSLEWRGVRKQSEIFENQFTHRNFLGDMTSRKKKVEKFEKSFRYSLVDFFHYEAKRKTWKSSSILMEAKNLISSQFGFVLVVCNEKILFVACTLLNPRSFNYLPKTSTPGDVEEGKLWIWRLNNCEISIKKFNRHWSYRKRSLGREN